MAKSKKTKKKVKRERREVGNCPFCESGDVPNYKNHKNLANFLSDRGRIVSSERTGICSKHQRLLTREIKRARQLGLLPFTSSV